MKREPYNKKINRVCKKCGFGSIPKQLSNPLTKFDLEMHMHSHNGEKIANRN